MITSKPDYFDAIQHRAENRWKQLEQDPELAAPWHQLFKQVQSPRHVISELLQNADDAEATEVSINIADGMFTFDHNGRDFSTDDFASLCRFGYSNKRLLRTIGFRGIGFKSTFSLGDTVGLRTPSLLVAFQKKRFTLPLWLNGETNKINNTRILVKIADEQRQKELTNNMQEWLNSPFSLLFFNHIRRVKLGDQDLHWKIIGDGPIPNSQWMGLQGQAKPYLVVRSEDEPFPEDALNEIRDERLLELSENTCLPPCKVEIVLGAPGQLFVVLPTGVKTSLPFAMNAPFIQDPARLKIKDPEISPTNRWLLGRIGKLAARAMLQWLQREDLEPVERARAYDFLPEPGLRDNSLEKVCLDVVSEASLKTIRGKPFVLSSNGSLELAGRCRAILPVLWDVWSGEQLLSIVCSKITDPVLLSNEISQDNQLKLHKHRASLALERDDFLNILVAKRPPQPKTWSALLLLWKLANGYYWKTRDLNIQPVRGKSELYAAKKIVRLGEKKLLQSEDDWDFLAQYLLVMDVNWPRYLTDQRRIAAENRDKELAEKIDAADRFMQKNDLHEPSNLDSVLDQVARNFFAQPSPDMEDCVRFTHIAAKLNAKSGNSIRFWTRDGKLKPASDPVLFDETGRLDELIPPVDRDVLLLHESYVQAFNSCTREEWFSWIQSGSASLKTFMPMKFSQFRFVGRQRIEDELKARDYADVLEYKYKSSEFQIDDWDFPQEYWTYWKKSALQNPALWAVLIERLLRQPKAWEYARSAKAQHIGSNGSLKSLVSSPITPGWIQKLRALPCLRDTRGNYRLPAELMRRTPQTEPLMDVEPFVDAHLDFESGRPLLDLLGVRSTPTGPGQILERLRALARAPKPPLLELTKWYQRLDAMFDDCSTPDQLEIKAIFHIERLIFTEDGAWQTSETAFITADENDAPGVALIHSMASQLSLWRKIGVHERPTVELTIEWLKGLPSGEKLLPADARRVKVLLGHHPLRIWQACEHWLNLAGEWVPGANLHFSLTMQSLIKWTNFHDWVKAQTADLQMLSAELTREAPFVSWLSLASQVEKRLEKPPRPGRKLALVWLQTLGRILTRITLNDEAQTARIRLLAARLAQSDGQQVETLSVLPYLNGKPAGLPENENLVWLDDVIYTIDIPKPRLVKQLSEIIAGIFDWPELKTILAYAFERSEQDILAYLDENFDLQSTDTNLRTTPETITQDPPRDLGKRLPGAPVAGDEDDEKEEEDDDDKLSPPVDREGSGALNGETTENQDLPARTKITLAKVALIERFALVCGYHKNGPHSYAHNDGSSLVKHDGVFPWLMQEPQGSVFRYLWLKEHCLQTRPLELPTEIWHLIEQDPDLHALILEDFDGEPLEMRGQELLELKQAGSLKLFPASYRLTLDLQN